MLADITNCSIEWAEAVGAIFGDRRKRVKHWRLPIPCVCADESSETTSATIRFCSEIGAKSRLEEAL
jgi:hypothetical protein